MYVQTNSGFSSRSTSFTGSRAPSRQSSFSLPSRSLPITRSRRFLGDDQSILAQVFQGQSGAPSAPLVQQTVQQAMSQGLLWTKENCSGIVTPGSQIASTTLSTAGGIAMKIAPATGPAAPFVLAAAGIAELFGAIFGHHAAKVKQEQQIICAVVQSVNDTFTALDQLVQSGQVTPQQASQSLDSIYPQIQAQVQPILKQDSGHCNAACFILAEARGVIAKKKDAYSKILPPQALPQCAQEYWRLYPDVAASSSFGPSAGPPGAWNHYQIAGQREGRTWPCDTSGNLLQQPGAASSGANPVAALAQSTGIPTWALWGVGLLVLKQLL